MNLQKRIDGALVRTAALQADRLRNALVDSVNVDHIVDEVLAAFPTDVPVSPVQARSWAEINVRLDMRQVALVVDEILATGWVLGQDSATTWYASVRLNKGYGRDKLLEALQTDWDAWTPGNRAAELLVRQPNGLQKLIANARFSTVDGMSKTTVNRIGTRLADALGKGTPPKELANILRGSIKEVANDPARAFAIANTEMCRAMNQSHLAQYEDFGVQYVEWLALEPCELCAANADAGAIPTGQLFPSEDDAPPAHPNCRCSLIAVVDEELLPPLEGEGDGLTPKMVAEQIYAQASNNEAAVSQFIKSIADESGAETFGWDFRLKTVDSLTRKLIDDAMNDYDGDIFKAAQAVSDSLRYTYLYDESLIAQQANSVIDLLREQGWNVRVKNSWREGSAYKGINCALTAPNGQLVELQFHTPESIAVKEPHSHVLYDQYRELDPRDPAAIALMDELVKLWDTVPQPLNIDLVK